jgi:hypothetical protein
MSRSELVYALLRHQVARATAVTGNAPNVWVAALKRVVDRIDRHKQLQISFVQSPLPHNHQQHIPTPLFALSVASSWTLLQSEQLRASPQDSIHLPTLLQRRRHSASEHAVFQHLLATLLVSRLHLPAGKSHVAVSGAGAHWCALMGLVEASARYHMPLPPNLCSPQIPQQRYKVRVVPDALELIVCHSSLDVASASELRALQFILFLCVFHSSAHASSSLDALMAHGMILTAQIQTLRRSAATDALRLWSAHCQLVYLVHHQQHRKHNRHTAWNPIDVLHIVQPVSTFLVGRVAELIAEASTLMSSAKPSTWDAVSLLCIESVPHLTAQLRSLRPSLRNWMQSAKSSPEGASTGCTKALALCSEVLTLVTTHEDAWYRDGGREQHQQDAIAAIGRQLLRVYRNFTHTPLVNLYHQKDSRPDRSTSNTIGGPAMAAIPSWGKLNHVLMGYRFHSAQSGDQRMTRLAALIDAVGHLPLDTTLTQHDWTGIHRTAMFAATSGASPVLSYHLLVRVFEALHHCSHHEDGAFDRVALLRGIEELACVLLPAVPVRLWLLLLMRIELSPASILQDLTTAQPEWDRITDVLSTSICAELPLSEIIRQFDAVQGDPSGGANDGEDAASLDRPLIQFPLPLLSMLVLERCISLATSQFSQSLAHPADSEKLLRLASKFGGTGSPHRPTFSCGGCVHREALLASCHRMLMRTAHQCDAARDNKIISTTNNMLTTTTTHLSHSSPSAVRARDVNLEIGGVWRRTITSAVIAVSTCVMIPSSPHRFRHILTRVLGGDASVPNPHHVMKAFFGGAHDTSCHSAVGRGVARLYHLWAGSVSSLWDTRAVISDRGPAGTVGEGRRASGGDHGSTRLAQLMLSENTTNGVAHIGGSTTAYSDWCQERPGAPQAGLDEPEVVPEGGGGEDTPVEVTTRVWHDRLAATGLLGASSGNDLSVDRIHEWILSTPHALGKGTPDALGFELGAALLLRHLLKKIYPIEVRRTVERGIFDRVTEAGEGGRIKLAAAVARGDHSLVVVMPFASEGEWATRIQRLMGNSRRGQAFARAMEFEQLLGVVSDTAAWHQDNHDSGKPSTCSGVAAYYRLVALLEEQVSNHRNGADAEDSAVNEVPHLLTLHPKAIPDSVHARYFTALQRSGNWQDAVAMVRRCQALQDCHRWKLDRRNEGLLPRIMDAVPAGECAGRTFLPSSVLGSVVVACLAADTAVPQDVRLSLLRAA